MTMPNKSIGKKIKIYSVATFVATFIAIILRTVCLYWFYDGYIGYYAKGVVPSIFYLVCLLAVAFFLGAFAVFKKDDELSDGKEDNVFLKIASGIAALAFVAFFVFSVMSTSLLSTNAIFDFLSKLSALMAIVYFLINLFGAEANKNAQTVLGFGIIIWSICVLGVTYFDISVQLNSPDKVTLHLGLVSAMSFFVSEFWCFVSVMKKKIYIFTLCAAVFFLGIASVPSIFNWLVSGMPANKYILYNIVLFALFVYSVARLASLRATDSYEETNEVDINE